MLRAARIIQFLGGVGLLFLSLFTLDVIQHGSPAARALSAMTWGLVLLWIVVGGLLMLRLRNVVREHVHGFRFRWRFGWKTSFVLLAIFLALIEEAITTTLTNLAPLFGVRVGEAYITASANYLDVILFHSVIVFVPMFIAWAWLLARYDFRPNTVFLLFGLTGTLAETLSFGAQSLINIGLWTYVYGLMIYLPAYCIPANRSAKPPRFYHVLLALIFPLICAIPVALIVSVIHPISIHFPPIGSAIGSP